jgi:hypothetical protein
VDDRPGQEIALAQAAYRPPVGGRRGDAEAEAEQERRDTEDALRRIAEIEELALMEQNPSAALAQPDTTARPRKRIDIPTLFRKLNRSPEEITGTEGANRNGYRRAEEGHHSACYVQTKDGRWVPLTRDWTAR